MLAKAGLLVVQVMATLPTPRTRRRTHCVGGMLPCRVGQQPHRPSGGHQHVLQLVRHVLSRHGIRHGLRRWPGEERRIRKVIRPDAATRAGELHTFAGSSSVAGCKIGHWVVVPKGARRSGAVLIPARPALARPRSLVSCLCSCSAVFGGIHGRPTALGRLKLVQRKLDHGLSQLSNVTLQIRQVFGSCLPLKPSLSRGW